MPSPPGSPTDDRPRRILFAAGTARYDSMDEESQLPSVEEDLNRITKVFRELGYASFGDPYLLNPTAQELRIALTACFSGLDRRPDDLIAVYYSGQGTVGHRHYLMTRDSDEARLRATAVSSDELPELFWPMGGDGSFARNLPRRALVILDSCYAAGGANDMAGVASRVLDKVPVPDPLSQATGLYILSCARSRVEAEQGAFSRALGAVLKDPKHGGRTQPFLLSPEELVKSINLQFEEQDLAQRASVSAIGVADRFLFLPNPEYQATWPTGLDLEAQRHAEWVSHWSPKGRGVEMEAEGGSFFTGRSAVLRNLVAWLTATAPDRRVRVLTGRPGSGKSAVLARLVLLSMAPDGVIGGAEEGTAPSPGIIDAAIHARGKTQAQVIAQLAQTAEASADGPELLVSALAESGRKLVVVLDALDEATEPGAIANLLGQMAAHLPSIRVVVGTRPNLLRRFPENARVVLDLDAPEHHEPDDLIRYVARRLIEEASSPYRDDPTLARAVAEVVARRAGTSFLVAQVISRTLAHSDRPIDVGEEGWHDRIPGDLDAAFERDLDRFGGERKVVVDLLEPLAYAEGRGLPWENIWSGLAAEISGRPRTDGDIRWLHRNAGAYIIEDQESGGSVYRLYHEEFARFLRDDRRAQEVQRRIAQFLIRSGPELPVGGRDWSKALPYVRAHLPAHAAPAGTLDCLLTDAMFLISAEPQRLIRQLPHARTEPARAAAKLYPRDAHHLRDASQEERLSYLELVARQDGVTDLARGLDWRRRRWPWRVSWAQWEPTHPFRILANHRGFGMVHAVLVCPSDGQAFAVSGGGDGIKVSDLTDGSLRWENREQVVWSLAAGALDDRPVIVAGCEDGEVRIWDLDDGSPVGRPFGGHGKYVRAVAVAELDGRPIVISGGRDGLHRFHDLSRQEPVASPIHAFKSSVQAVAVGRIDDRSSSPAATNSAPRPSNDPSSDCGTSPAIRH
jgi:hypothetical protein